jgi:hypothetical protein
MEGGARSLSPRLGRLVRKHNLEKFSQTLVEEGVVSSSDFAFLTAQQVEKLGATRVGEQLKFSKAIAAARTVAEDDESFAVPRAKRDRSPDGSPDAAVAPTNAKRVSMYMPDTDPRSTSLYQSIYTYTSSRSQGDVRRRSGDMAINAQITKSGGEVAFVNRVITLFPKIKEKCSNLHGLPLDELAQLVISAYPQPWSTHIDVRDRLSSSREGTPSPSPRKVGNNSNSFHNNVVIGSENGNVNNNNNNNNEDNKDEGEEDHDDNDDNDDDDANNSVGGK